MTMAEVERKLAVIEREITLLKQQSGTKKTTGKWWIDTAGAFADDPGFLEMVRLGRKYRESLRPARAKRRKRSR